MIFFHLKYKGFAQTVMKEYDVKTVLYVVIKYLFRKVISFFKDAFTSKFVLIYMTFIFVFLYND